MLHDPAATAGRGRRLPRRRHPRSAATSSAAAGCAWSGSRSASAPSSATRGWPRPDARCRGRRWSRCSRRRPGARGQGRDLVARAARRAAAPRPATTSTTAAPTTRRAAAGGPRARRGVPRGARGGARCVSPSSSLAALDVACWTTGRWLGRRSGGLVLAARCGRGRPHVAGQVGAGRADATVGASLVELVRLAQRAGRHLRGGRGRPVVRAGGEGTAVLNVWLRCMGAKIGRGVWCETYWLPETDLVDLRGRRHRQPGVRRADPPVPRPGAEHGPGDPRRRAPPWAPTA